MESSLQAIGLSDYEIKCYLALLKQSPLTGLELSRNSMIPQGKIYLTAQKLIDKGFIKIISQNPKRFHSIDPKIAIKQFLKDKREFYDHLMNTLPEQLTHLRNPINSTTTDEKITIFRGKKNAFPIAYYLYETATQTIDVMMTFELLTTQSRKLLLAAKDKGVKVRILATKKENITLISEITKLGFTIKYYPVDELRLLIIDETSCMESIVNPKDLTDRTNIYIQSKELTKALALYFNAVWKKAKIIK